jgi:uncharacterized protein (DUF4415 family)
MTSGEDIRRYTATELQEMLARGEDETDWARVRAMTEEELEANIASDPAWKDVPRDWYKDAVLVNPMEKKLMSLRIDQDIIDWFKEQGPGYQTRMNAVLRAYVTAARKVK